MAEQLTLNQWVQGSSPWSVTHEYSWMCRSEKRPTLGAFLCQLQLYNFLLNGIFDQFTTVM